jgi:hypothetical protein
MSDPTRPAFTTFTVDVLAQDEIASAYNRCASIGSHWGTSSKEYIDAMHSWAHALSNLFGRPWAAEGQGVTVWRDGPKGSLSLMVNGSITLGVVFHSVPRTCLTEGCDGVINDDGSVWTFTSDGRLCDNHQESWPLNVQGPGTWSTHS